MILEECLEFNLPSGHFKVTGCWAEFSEYMCLLLILVHGDTLSHRHTRGLHSVRLTLWEPLGDAWREMSLGRGR